MKNFRALIALVMGMVLIFSLAACSAAGGSVDLSQLLDQTVDFAGQEGAKQLELGQKWLSFLGDEANQKVDAAKDWAAKQSPEVLEKTKGSLESLLKWGSEALQGGDESLKSLGLDKLIGGKLPELGKFTDIIQKLIGMLGK